MSKELLYLLCAGSMKERELYAAFAGAPGPSELERASADRFSSEDIGRARSRLEAMAKQAIRVTSLYESDYPAVLRSIDYPPPVLFYCGEYREEDRDAVAFVGSRDASAKGMQLAAKFVEGFRGCPVTIVSGMALGIDSTAHQAALNSGLRTIAVLGSGLDIIYPAQNKQLFKSICERGAVFSEHPPGVKPLPYHFPKRNRIISGLSKAIVIVEAGEKSGSLITARLAMQQNREVFAVPRTPVDKNAGGTNNLIKLGAKIATAPEDILEDLFPGLGAGREQKPAPQLTPEEEKVFRVLGEEPVNIDRLCFLLDMGPARLANFLLSLEMKGVIKELPGRHFVKY